MSKVSWSVFLSVRWNELVGLYKSPRSLYHGFVTLWSCVYLQMALNRGPPRLDRSVSHSSLDFFCSREQSNDELVMKILSDMLKRLPLSVEKEKCAGTPSTLKSIMSSPTWESLYKGLKGKHGTSASFPHLRLLRNGLWHTEDPQRWKAEMRQKLNLYYSFLSPSWEMGIREESDTVGLGGVGTWPQD